MALTLILALARVEAATKPASAPDSSPIQILPGTSSKEPISIDADKLVYSDKEKKAVYSGNVVVIQGDTKMTCSVMTVFLDHSSTPLHALAQRDLQLLVHMFHRAAQTVQAPLDLFELVPNVCRDIEIRAVRTNAD